MSKQLRLVSNNQDFKVSDTAEIIRFNMIGDDGQPYPIVKGDKPQFRISALVEYKLIDAQVAGASQVSFNSQQINDPKPLPAGTYNFELWITHQNGTVSIFPDDNYLSFTLNKNIMGFASEKVTNLSLESVETEALKYIDDRVKELKAAGLKGDPGKDATLDIGTDGNWIVNGKDLGRKAQGPAGKDGQPGKNFNIAKTFASKKAMSGDGLADGDFVMISSNVNDPDNADVFVWDGKQFNFLVDMSGATGLRGNDGDAATLQIGNVTTTAGTTPAVQVTNKGNANHAVLDMAFTLVNGKDAHTPVRGTDYWTDADKAEIKSYVDDAIENGKW